MAVTQNSFTGNGSTTNYSFTFPYLKASDVKASINAVETTAFTLPNATTLQFNTAPANGANILIFRETGIDDLTATFFAGSAIKSEDLNDNFTQNLFVTQEVNQRFLSVLGGNAMQANLQLGKGVDIVFEGDTDDAHETTLEVEDPTSDRTITIPNVSGNIVTTGDTGTVTSTMITDGTIVNGDIANTTITGSKLVNDTITATQIANNAVTANELADNSVDRAAIVGDAVDGTKIADDSIDSEHIVADSIDTEHYAPGSVDGTALGADSVNGTKIADNSIDSEHYVDGSIDTAHVANGAITDTQIATGTLDNRYYTETELDAGQLDGRYFTETELTGGSLDGRYFTETELTGGSLDGRYFTETELTGGALDGRYYTETEAEAKFLRQDSSETIASGVTWSNSDAFVATTAAINARIIDLVDDVGGFTAIANETSFPDVNPQASSGKAAILSIATIGTARTPSGTTVTIANGNASSNATITITGVPSVLPAGFGILVESTSTLHTYTFHRLVPKATEVTTVAANATAIAAAGNNVADINNFADLYQISANQPSQRVDGTSLSEGDLWYDSSNDNIRVYDGSSFSAVTPTQQVLNDIAIVSGAVTYQEDLGLITDAVTTGSSNGSLDIVADIIEDEITLAITVINSGGNKYVIDSDTSNPAKTLTLYKGWTYTFDQSDSSNANHPLRFKTDSGSYTTNVTAVGTPGNAGAYTRITIPESQPTGFRYYCTVHGNGMGNTITVQDDPIKTVADNINNINTVATNNNNVNTIVGSIANVNTVGSNITNINTFATTYFISANAPSSPTNGDLWYDSTNDVLKNYNGSAWLGITSNSGIANVVDDSTPQLGGALDGQNNNLNNIGTIDGTNLQLDFGTI